MHIWKLSKLILSEKTSKLAIEFLKYKQLSLSNKISRIIFISRKRYEKAEKEFITAKESLFLKSERKDQLTAHLANIIQLNEERKAKKLTELMEELNIPLS